MTPTGWLLSDDTGISSKTILAVMEASSIRDPGVPHDPSDFGRCYRLLQWFPIYRLRLPEVAARYPAWRPFVEAWDELTALYEQECQNKNGMAPRLYDRMQELVEAGYIIDGWTRVPGGWTRTMPAGETVGKATTTEPTP